MPLKYLASSFSSGVLTALSGKSHSGRPYSSSQPQWLWVQEEVETVNQKNSYSA